MAGVVLGLAVLPLACTDPRPAPDAGRVDRDAGAQPGDAQADSAPDGAADLDAAVRDLGAPPPEAGMADAATLIDRDLDGLDDRLEQTHAEAYQPFRSLDPEDGCPRSVVLFRARPHPAAPDRRWHLIYVSLFERDCGAGGHVGDDEVIGVTIDPATPPPAGILAITAVSHQGTLCEETTRCGSCPGGQLTACTLAPRRGADFPVVFFSRGKHGAYLSEAACDASCFVTNFCALAATSSEVPLFNAGEPEAPLLRDLTAAGAITSTAGWVEPALFGYDPWGGADFGGAGSVASDLVDPAFLTPACR